MNRVAKLRERLGRDRFLLAVVGAVAVLAVAVRLVALGRRVFYFDEAWLGYWVLKSLDTGIWRYRPIVHGPFFARVNGLVFRLFGANEVTARFIVAAVGGATPLSAWLFRERLRDSSVIALAVLLAANPILLYYSRFMRNDVLLAAFAMFTVGFAVRALDTGRPRYLYAAAATLALAFTTKESALLYAVTWLGAGTLLLDRRLLRARDREGGWIEAVENRVRWTADRAPKWAPHLIFSTVLFFAIIVYFYAPRSAGIDRPGLWKAFRRPSMFPAVIEAATIGSVRRALDYWASGTIQGHPYLPYLRDTLETLATGAPAVLGFGTLGFLLDRYGGEAPRDLVAFSFYGGVAAIVGYPLANNFPVPWSTVHAVAPLTVPAAVGASAVYRWGVGDLAALDRPHRRVVEDRLGTVPWETLAVGATAVLIALSSAHVATTAIGTSYQRPHESPKGDVSGSEIVYYAQAPAELREVIDAIQLAASYGGDDADVLYVGASIAYEPEFARRPPPPGGWYRRLPLPWYTEAAGADVVNAKNASAIGSDPPPVVITTPAHRAAVDRVLPDAYAGERYALDDIGGRPIVVFTLPTGSSADRNRSVAPSSGVRSRSA